MATSEYCPGVAVTDPQTSIRLCRELIYRFFPGNIRSSKVWIDPHLYPTKQFSFKRPFAVTDATRVTPAQLTAVFPKEELYVLPHHPVAGVENTVLQASSSVLFDALSDLDNPHTAPISGVMEWAYIFDQNFTHCFWVHDSTTPIQTPTGNIHQAIMLMYSPCQIHSSH